MERFHRRIVPPSTARAVDLLAQATGLPKARLKDCMAKGGVWRIRPGGKPQRLRRATAMVAAGEVLEIWYDASLLARPAPALAPARRGPCWSVWAKPAGIPTQGSPWGDHLALTRLAAEALGLPGHLHPVYRLDAAASGLVLLAHHGAAMASLCRQMEEGRMAKAYTAVLHGQADWAERRITTPVGGQRAESHFRVVEADDQRTWVEVCLATGRRHQIRIHAARDLGLPVAGDTRHGNAASGPLLLACTWLSFRCPATGETVTVAWQPDWSIPPTTCGPEAHPPGPQPMQSSSR